MGSLLRSGGETRQALDATSDSQMIADTTTGGFFATTAILQRIYAACTVGLRSVLNQIGGWQRRASAAPQALRPTGPQFGA
jgi:hypothetical protein